jgi:hypothetical protein
MWKLLRPQNDTHTDTIINRLLFYIMLRHTRIGKINSESSFRPQGSSVLCILALMWNYILQCRKMVSRTEAAFCVLAYNGTKCDVMVRDSASKLLIFVDWYKHFVRDSWGRKWKPSGRPNLSPIYFSSGVLLISVYVAVLPMSWELETRTGEACENLAQVFSFRSVQEDEQFFDIVWVTGGVQIEIDSPQRWTELWENLYFWAVS